MGGLDLGTLTGYLTMDDSRMDKVLDNLPGKLGKSGLATNAAALLLGAGAGAAIGQGLATAISGADATAKLTAELGLTEVESARIGEVAGRLYADAYGDSIESVSDAVAGVISSIEGMRTANDSTVEAMTAKVLNFGTTFETDTSRVTQVVGQMLKSGLVADADEAMDLLTATFQRVPKAVREDILDAVDEYGPFFTAMGIDGRTAMGILEQASAQGMYGIDKAGDAVKEFTIRSTDMSTASVAAYETIGLNAEDMARRLVAGGAEAQGAFGEIVHALQGVEDPVTQANAAIALFGTPLEDLGVQEIRNFLGLIDPAGDKFDEVAGAADRMGEAINSGPTVRLETLNRKWQEQIGTIGERLLPVLTAVTDWALENPGVLSAVAIGLGILAVAFIGVSIATWAMNTALLANPITWIVVGIVALIGALVWLIANWDTVVSFVTDVWGNFTTWLGDSLASIGAWFASTWDGIVGFLGDVWASIVSGVRDGWDAVVTWIVGAWTRISEGVAQGWADVMAWIEGIPGAIGEFFQGVGGWLVDAGRMLLEGLATGIALAIIGVIYLFTQFPTDLMNWMSGAGQWLVTTGTDILTGLVNGIVSGWTAVSTWFQELPGRIGAFLTGVGIWLLVTGSQLLAGLRAGIDTGWTAVSTWFVELPGRVLAFLTGVGVWLITTGSTLLAGLLNGIRQGWTATVTFSRKLPGRVLAFLGGVGSWLIGSGRSLLDGMTNGIRQGWSGAVGFFQALPGNIMGTFANIGSWLYNSGRDLVNGLLSGVRSLAGTIGRFFLDLLPGWVVGPFKAALGIASPSKVFRGFGRDVVNGLVLGVDDGEGDVAARMASLVDMPTARRSGPGEPMDGEDGYGPAGTKIDRSINFHGPVIGGDAEEVARIIRGRDEQEAQLQGVDDLEFVA